jgi:Transposase IS66 family
MLGRLGIGVTAGALSSGAQATGTALVPLHREIVAAVNRSAVVVPDETDWRVLGEGAWLWVVATDGATA